MKNILQKILKSLAKTIINKYQPQIIGITGSIGKTSTKDAISAVLKTKYKVRKSYKNYNTEIGLPLTVIGLKSPGSSVLGWFWVFMEALKIIIFRQKNYPKILVLEMAADYPGDIKYLLSIVKPDVSVITAIEPVHLEKFKKLEKIIKEKSLLAFNVKKNGYVVLNIDNQHLQKLASEISTRLVTYGISNQSADNKAIEIAVKFVNDQSLPIDQRILGMNFKILSKGSAVPAQIKGVVGQQHIYASLAAAAVGQLYKINLLEISVALKKYNGPAGRMRLIKGIKKTLIIDDSYNSAPKSCQKALEALADLPKINHKWAILGDMLELDQISSKEHFKIGQMVANQDIDYLATVGERSTDIKKGALSAGLAEENIFSFDYSADAGRFIQKKLQKGDLLLVKGSQGARMEKIVKELMAEPLRAKELIVRQDDHWLKS